MNIFKGQTLLEFSDRFKTDTDCREYLAGLKSEIPFKCSRCHHTTFQTRADFSRQCNICRHTESATSDTLFHKVKFGVRKAFSFVLRWLQVPKVYRQVIWEYVTG